MYLKGTYILQIETTRRVHILQEADELRTTGAMQPRNKGFSNYPVTELGEPPFWFRKDSRRMPVSIGASAQ